MIWPKKLIEIITNHRNFEENIPNFTVNFVPAGRVMTKLDFHKYMRPGALVTKTYCVKSLLVSKDFQTWLIGWQHNHQPFRSHIRKFLLTNMEFNMDFI